MTPNPQPAAMTEERLKYIQKYLYYSPLSQELIAELSRLREERDRMKAIVDKLPKTADGVPITPGMKIFVLRESDEDSRVEQDTIIVEFETYNGYEPTDRGYSTREAALAATPHAGEKEA